MPQQRDGLTRLTGDRGVGDPEARRLDPSAVVALDDVGADQAGRVRDELRAGRRELAQVAADRVDERAHGLRVGAAARRGAARRPTNAVLSPSDVMRSHATIGTRAALAGRRAASCRAGPRRAGAPGRRRRGGAAEVRWWRREQLVARRSSPSTTTTLSSANSDGLVSTPSVPGRVLVGVEPGDLDAGSAARASATRRSHARSASRPSAPLTSTTGASSTASHETPGSRGRLRAAGRRVAGGTRTACQSVTHARRRSRPSPSSAQRRTTVAHRASSARHRPSRAATRTAAPGAGRRDPGDRPDPPARRTGAPCQHLRGGGPPRRQRARSQSEHRGRRDRGCDQDVRRHRVQGRRPV